MSYYKFPSNFSQNNLRICIKSRIQRDTIFQIHRFLKTRVDVSLNNVSVLFIASGDHMP